MLKIANGTLYDPANGIDGQVRDVWIDDGRVVAAPSDPATKPSRVIDATGLVVMPGGVDMHCHIAGPKVNAARKLRPDDKRRGQPMRRGPITRSGTLGSVPSTFATSYKYAGLGYTTVMDAAIPPLGARQAHQELADTPCLDTGLYALVGNNRYALECLESGDQARLQAYLGWLIGRTKAYAPKVVNPGGVEAWKQSASGNVAGLDDAVPRFDLTARQIIQGLARAANDLGLPHPLHLHCNQLGLPGNWTTTLDTMRALDGLTAHLSHIQFHSYGGGDRVGGDNGNEASLSSRVAELAEYINSHKNLSVDVGQVMFGPTTTMTGDGPLGYYLYKATGARWIGHDTEVEAGCGVLPIEYRNKNLFHALQWAVGLEWYLLVDDPWRVVMSTDHPNGGSFLAYPEIIRLLMDRTYRGDVLKTCPRSLAERTQLADLTREYTLGEIAIITRAGPARLLGLAHKGHLGPGADADVTILTPNDNPAKMFELPRMVIKAGEVIVEDSEIRAAPHGQTIYTPTDFDEDRLADLPAFFERHYSIGMDEYGVSSDEIRGSEAPVAGQQGR